MQDQNIVQQFESEQFGTIRTTTIDGEPWFVAKDVCVALGIRSDTVRNILDDDEVSETNPNTIGVAGGRKPLIISEAGLYGLVLKSRKPEAKAFKRWVTHEVLPSIRRDGGYIATREDDNEDSILARAVLIADKKIKALQSRNDELESKNAEMQPKAFFADAVSTSHTSILVGDLAKLMKQNGFNVGQNRLFEILRRDGYLMKSGSSKNMPTQRSAEMKLFEVKEGTVSNPDGSIRITRTTKVTGKGQVYFLNHYCNKTQQIPFVV